MIVGVSTGSLLTKNIVHSNEMSIPFQLPSLNSTYNWFLCLHFTPNNGVWVFCNLDILAGLKYSICILSLSLSRSLSLFLSLKKQKFTSVANHWFYHSFSWLLFFVSIDIFSSHHNGFRQQVIRLPLQISLTVSSEYNISLVKVTPSIFPNKNMDINIASKSTNNEAN